MYRRHPQLMTSCGDRMITSDIVHLRLPTNAVLLSVSLVLVPVFIFWVGRQEKLHKPALILNSIWKNKAFTSICLMVLLSCAVMQTMELSASLLYVSTFIQHCLWGFAHRTQASKMCSISQRSSPRSGSFPALSSVLLSS